MGERGIRFGALLKRDQRCIYCADKPTQIEHMPPRGMFKGKARPKGLEFACCAACNKGTASSDLVAAYIAKFDKDAAPDHWGLRENLSHARALNEHAPGVMEELFGGPDREPELLWQNGLLRSFVRFRANGPLVRHHLNTFAAKLGMALYRQHVGQALPLEGKVLSFWFLNGGINQDIVDAATSKLPLGGTLRQGKLHVTDQFAYRYNSDERTVLSAFSAFHQGLYVLNIAAREPDRFALHNWLEHETATLASPGAFLAGYERL